MFSFNLGSGPAVITSTSQLSLGEWHTIEVSRNRYNGNLMVDGAPMVLGSSQGPFTGLQLGEYLFLGGVPEHSNLPASLGVSSGFVGCVRALSYSSTPIDLIGAAVDSIGVAPCTNVNPCLVQPCQNGGTCTEELGNTFSCQCAVGWIGQQCKTFSTQCQTANLCLNGGVCMVRLENGLGVEYCNCSLPYGGPLCNDSK